MMLKIQKTTDKLIFTPSRSEKKGFAICHSMHNRLALGQKMGQIADPHSEDKTVKTADSKFSANRCAKRDMQGKYKYSVYVYRK